MHSKYFAGLFIVLLSACAPDKPKEMKFDLAAEEGKTYRINIFRETSKQFQDIVRTDTVNMQMDIHVLPKSGDLNKVELTLLNVSARMPMVRVNQTEFDMSTILDPMFAAAKGLSIQAQIDGKGITQSVEGIDELLNTISSKLNKNKAEVKNSLADYISEKAIKDNLNRLFSSVAFKKVAPGENWGSDVVLTTKAPVNINSLYTLNSLQSDSAFINIHSTIVAGSAGNFYLNGQQNGAVILNYKTGLPYKYETSSQTVTKTNSYDVKENERFLALFGERFNGR